jgi:hypothetical protein
MWEDRLGEVVAVYLRHFPEGKHTENFGEACEFCQVKRQKTIAPKTNRNASHNYDLNLGNVFTDTLYIQISC